MSPLIFSLLFKDFLGCSRSFEFPWELEGRFINFYKEASGDSDGLGRSWPVTLLKMDFLKNKFTFTETLRRHGDSAHPALLLAMGYTRYK